MVIAYLSPGPPSNVTVAPTNSTAMLVEWGRPVIDERHGRLQSYTVLCRSPQNSSFFLQVSVTDLSMRNLTLSRLLPYTNYNCCLSAITNTANSPFSCVQSTTLQDRKANGMATTTCQHKHNNLAQYSNKTT